MKFSLLLLAVLLNGCVYEPEIVYQRIRATKEPITDWNMCWYDKSFSGPDTKCMDLLMAQFDSCWLNLETNPPQDECSLNGKVYQIQ